MPIFLFIYGSVSRYGALKPAVLNGARLNIYRKVIGHIFKLGGCDFGVYGNQSAVCHDRFVNAFVRAGNLVINISSVNRDVFPFALLKAPGKPNPARGILIAIGAVRLPLKAGNLGLEKHIAGKLAARKAYDRVFGYIGSGSYTPYNIRIIRLAVFGYGDASYFRNPRGIATAG